MRGPALALTENDSGIISPATAAPRACPRGAHVMLTAPPGAYSCLGDVTSCFFVAHENRVTGFHEGWAYRGDLTGEMGGSGIGLTNRSRFVPVAEALSRLVPDSNRGVVYQFAHGHPQKLGNDRCFQWSRIATLSLSRNFHPTQFAG